MLIDNRDEIESALSKDFSYRSRDVTMIGDIKAAVAGFQVAAAQVEAWMAPEPCTALAEGAEARIEFVPKGVVGVVGPWNFPFNLVLTPLAGILAAGNRAVLKPSEFTPEGSALMARLVAEAFDPDEVVVVTGPDESAAFTAAPFDHLIFTGSTTVARHVMRAAAENLTPLTLEFGGKIARAPGRSVCRPITRWCPRDVRRRLPKPASRQARRCSPPGSVRTITPPLSPTAISSGSWVWSRTHAPREPRLSRRSRQATWRTSGCSRRHSLSTRPTIWMR